MASLSVRPLHTGHGRLLFLLLCILHGHSSTCSVYDAEPSQRGPCSASTDLEFGGLRVDCSDRGLSSLHPQWFPENSTTLILDGNPLKVFTSGSLGTLTRLRQLSLVSCGLYSLERHSLKGLPNLESLYLSQNLLDLLRHELPLGVFSHVPKLKHLDVGANRCWNQTSSPQDLFRDFENLESLVFKPCQILQVGTAFASLQRLKVLHIDGHNLSEVHNSSLRGLATVPLETFIMTDGRDLLKRFDIGVFQYLQHIKVLRLENVAVGNKQALASLWPFRNRHLDLIHFEELKLKAHSDTQRNIEDGYITAFDARHVITIYVDEFRWLNCRVFGVEPEFASHSTHFAKSVKRVEIINNMLGVADEWRVFLLKLLTFPALEHFSYGEFGFKERTKKAYLIDRFGDMDQWLPLDKEYEPVTQTTDHKNIHASEIAAIDAPQINSTKAPGLSDGLYLKPMQSKPSFGGYWLGMRNLRVLRFYNIRGRVYLYDMMFRNGHKLREMSIVNAHKIIFKGVLVNILNVNLLDISGSAIYYQNNVFFESFRGISVLLMNDAKNPQMLVDWRTQRNTAILRKLTFLEARNNHLEYLPADLFASNIKLKHVGLRGNRFPGIPFDLDTVPLLTSLDLRDNAIIELTAPDMMQVDKHLEGTGSFFVSLSGNTFLCGCQQYSFISWLKTTKVKLDREDYSCISDSGELTSTDQLDIQAIWRGCVGQMALCIALVVYLVAALVFLLTFTWGRFKMAVLSFVFGVLVPTFRLKTPGDYTHDVFFGYADDDYRFVRYCLLPCIEGDLGWGRTYIHQRDLRGGYAEEQLLDALAKSWRILLVISDTFLYNYDPSQSIIELCSLSVSAENPRRVVALVQDSLTNRLPAELVPLLSEDNILPVQNWRLPLTHAQRAWLKRALSQ